MADSSYNPEFQDGSESLDSLFQRVREKEEAKIKESIDKKKKEASHFKWIRFGVYLWAARLGFSIFGAIIPFSFEAFFGITDSPPVGLNAAVNHRELLITISWDELVDSNYQLIEQLQKQRDPFIITNSPLKSQKEIKHILTSLFETHKVPIKINESPFFRYFTTDRIWSKYYPIEQQAAYQYIQKAQYEELMRNNQIVKSSTEHSILNNLFDMTSDATENLSNNLLHCPQSEELPGTCRKSFQLQSNPLYYTYVGYTHMLDTLPTLCPTLYQLTNHLLHHLLLSPSHRKPQEDDSIPQYSTTELGQRGGIISNLWIAQEDVIAGMHYDLQDNFLVQLVGGKEVIIVSPEGRELISPYSSLHPYWRQSMHYNLTFEYLEELVLTTNTQHQQPHQHPQQHQQRTLAEEIKRIGLWQVTLSPGDILYLPAGYYHQVTNIPHITTTIDTSHNEDEVEVLEGGSIALNVWYPSVYSQYAGRLARISLAALFQPEYTLNHQLHFLVEVLQTLDQLWLVTYTNTPTTSTTATSTATASETATEQSTTRKKQSGKTSKGPVMTSLWTQYKQYYSPLLLERKVKREQTTTNTVDSGDNSDNRAVEWQEQESICIDKIASQLCINNPKKKVTSSFSFENHSKVKKLASDINTVLAANTRSARMLSKEQTATVPLALKTLALFDYVDEILVLLFTKAKYPFFPCTMELVVQECWRKPS